MENKPGRTALHPFGRALQSVVLFLPCVFLCFGIVFFGVPEVELQSNHELPYVPFLVWRLVLVFVNFCMRPTTERPTLPLHYCVNVDITELLCCLVYISIF